MNQKREIIVRVREIICHNTTTAGTDDVYFISTLRVEEDSRSFNLSADNPMPKHITTVSDVIEEVDEDKVPRKFNRNTLFDGTVPLKTPPPVEERKDLVIEGCVYFIARDDKKDIDQEPKKLNLKNVAIFSTVLGWIMALLFILPYPIRVSFLIPFFLRGLGIVAVLDLISVGVSYLFNRVIEFIASPWDGNDDYIAGFRVRVPVAGDKGIELVPGTPHVRREPTDDLSVKGRKVVFDGIGTWDPQHYKFVLEVERKEITS